MIRHADLDDVEAIVLIESVCFPSDSWSATLVEQEIAAPHRTVMVDVREDAVVAYAAVSITAEVADLDRIAVLPALRSRGIARELLERLIDTARDLGAGRMLLEVAATNDAAVGLYESLGFATISSRKNYYPDGVDALVMELTIEEWR